MIQSPSKSLLILKLQNIYSVCGLNRYLAIRNLNEIFNKQHFIPHLTAVKSEHC